MMAEGHRVCPKVCRLCKDVTIDCSHSRLDKPPILGANHNLAKIKTLNLNSNELESLGSLSSFTNLQVLNVAQNLLKQVPNLSGLFKLRKLVLSENLIKQVPANAFRNLTQIRKLFLNNNRITFIDPRSLEDLTKLEALYLSRNRLSRLSRFPELPSLEVLLLGKNALTTCALLTKPFLNLRNLDYLSLSANHIHRISNGVLKTSGSVLVKIWLKDNKIERILEPIHAKNVYLTNNSLEDTWVFDENFTFTNIFVANNQLSCRLQRQVWRRSVACEGCRGMCVELNHSISDRQDDFSCGVAGEGQLSVAQDKVLYMIGAIAAVAFLLSLVAICGMLFVKRLRAKNVRRKVAKDRRDRHNTSAQWGPHIPLGDNIYQDPDLSPTYSSVVQTGQLAEANVYDYMDYPPVTPPHEYLTPRECHGIRKENQQPANTNYYVTPNTPPSVINQDVPQVAGEYLNMKA